MGYRSITIPAALSVSESVSESVIEESVSDQAFEAAHSVVLPGNGTFIYYDR